MASQFKSLSTVLHAYLAETTAHGLARISSGDRPVYLKLMWLSSFLGLLVWFGITFSDAVAKLVSAKRDTAVYAFEVPFRFPDLYVCGCNPVSGSRSVSLTAAQADTLRRQMAPTLATLNNLTDLSPVDLLKYAVNSLPFHLTADLLGHSLSQMIAFASIEGDISSAIRDNQTASGRVPFSSFHHPAFLRCARLNLAPTDADRLRQPEAYLHLALTVDSQLLSYTVDSNQVYVPFSVLGRRHKAYPAEWSLELGWNIFVESGLRLFLVEPGTYPTPWSTSMLIRPGTMTEVRISMQQVIYQESQFTGQCVPNSRLSQVQFVNPYDGSLYDYNYSLAFCYYTEFARRMQRLLNCSNKAVPLTAAFRHLRNCYNASGLGAGQLIGLANKKLANQDQLKVIATQVSDACTTQSPCTTINYQVEWSASDWPVAAFADVMTEVVHSRIGDLSDKSFYRIYYAEKSAVGSNASAQQLEKLANMLSSQVALVRLNSRHSNSDQLRVTLAYTFNNLFAETGGLLGLFLGCSLLTLLEIVELLHNCIICCMGRRKRVEAKPS